MSINSIQNNHLKPFFRKPRSKLLFFFGLFLLLLPVCTGLTGCSSEVNAKPAQKSAGSQPAVPAAKFSVYKEIPVNITPAVKPYKVDSDLGNITNKDMFEFYPEAKKLLVKNGFVVVPKKHREFFDLYETNRYEPIPLFLTTDSILHNYHLFFDHLLKTVETEKLAPELKELNKAMLNQSQEHYNVLKSTGWENAAKRNIGFFTVAGKLSDPGVTIPSLIKKEVEKELTLIEEHRSIDVSPVMNIGSNSDSASALKEDYSQYIPRGHYEKSDILQAYFKSMMWYGRLTFRLKNEDEIKSAVLITLAVDKDENRQRWVNIYEPTGFLAGQSDDITYYQIKKLLEEIYGSSIDLQTIISSQEKWKKFLKAAAELKPPAINSMPDREKEIKGFRFMGQRFTIDAFILQKLVYPEVQENKQGELRTLPSGMDIPAAMGSKEAYTILQSTRETEYRNYPQNMVKMKEFMAGLNKETLTQSLYGGWLYALMPLIQEKQQGYPSFMNNSAWARKDINTFLGSWTELKHDTILYTKPVYAEAGGGGDNIDDRGYVETNPYVYARLASLVKMTREGLQAANLLNDRDKTSLERMEELAVSLKTISEKELNSLPLTLEEYNLIRSYGAQLEHFWLEALRDEGIDHRSAIYSKPPAVIADVATSPSNGKVLEEATGYIFEIYAVVPVEGKLRIAKGGVYSYYEFTWPLADRLTDTKWHEMLDAGKTPPLPGWTSVFMAP